MISEQTPPFGRAPALVPQDIKNRSQWDVLTKSPQHVSHNPPTLTEKVQSEPKLPILGANDLEDLKKKTKSSLFLHRMNQDCSTLKEMTDEQINSGKASHISSQKVLKITDEAATPNVEASRVLLKEYQQMKKDLKAISVSLKGTMTADKKAKAVNLLNPEVQKKLESIARLRRGAENSYSV